ATDRDHPDNTGAAAVGLRLVDDRGRTSTVELQNPALRPLNEWVWGDASYNEQTNPPESGPAHVILSDARVPASAFAKVDLGRIERISLVLGPRGAMYLGGASLQ
ncbi:MAG TPA: hypothetical protein VMY88_01510, partial [Acidimicrobiales bacterium]|nr:hypothetical protein [Acidimicrobiales bacterium]